MNFFVSSNQTSEIYLVYPDGTVTTFLALPSGSDPVSIAEGKNGKFYVANAADLFLISTPPLEDGQIMWFDALGNYEVMHDGAPLMNPFDVHPVKCPPMDPDEGSD